MYAIIRTGGKQYRVEEGRSLNVELLPAKEGSSVELKDVLLIANNGDVTVGTPVIDGARVLADVEAHGRDKKIIVFKYKAKVRTRKKTGHRQHFTRLAVTEILAPGQESKAAKPKRRKKTDDKVASAEASAEADAEAKATVDTKPAAEDKPAPKKRTRKAAAPKAAATAAEAKTPTEEVEEKPKRKPRKPAAAKASSKESTDTEEKKPAPKRASRAKATKKEDEE